MTILAILLVRNLRVENVSKKQLLLEAAISFFQKFFMGVLGERGKRLCSLYDYDYPIYRVREYSRDIGFVPPTKDLNVTAGLAIMSILLVEYAGIHQSGVKGWLKSFAKPRR